MWYLLSCSQNLSLKAQIKAEILSFKVWVPAVQKNAKFWKKLYLGQKNVINCHKIWHGHKHGWHQVACKIWASKP